MTPDGFDDLLALCLLRIEDEGIEALDRLCDEHPTEAARLREHVQDLLGAPHLSTLETPAREGPVSHEPAPLPEHVGPYKVVRILGEGGMGTVFLAEQSEPVRRQVAIKVIKLGMDSRQVLARFELERQALALMNHPAIAQVLDAGTTASGKPYFVMEYVEGVPLTDYCEHHRLTLDERIDLFRQVCYGVQHAHQKGILHRDLKPSNILVLRKGDGQHHVKLIDFGLARATERQVVEHTLHTEEGVLIGTPEYMSPEQAGGGGRQVDTRTDVYSLGVVLYQVLAGILPFDGAALRVAGVAEILRIIQHEEPPRPSSRVATASAAVVTQNARNRQMSTGAYRRFLRGELDWIVMKAVAKEPERRYDSAVALARDLERFVAGEPVEAGPPSTAYRLRKVLARYRIQALSAAAVLVTAVAGALLAVSYAADAEAARKLAERNAGAALREAGRAKEAQRLAEERQDELLLHLLPFQLESARAEVDAMVPAWPEQYARLDRWARERGRKFAAELPRIRGMLRDLRARALPRSPTELQADRTRHPRYREYANASKRVLALQRAVAVHDGRGVPDQPAVPDVEGGIEELIARGWAAVDPDRPAAAYGDEVWGLALLRRAHELASRGSDPTQRDTVRARLACGLFANGQDAAARALLVEARDAAPADARGRWTAELAGLDARIAARPQTLKAAEAELRALEEVIAERRTWKFPTEEEQFRHATLVDVERGLQEFVGRAGPVGIVEDRMRWARTLPMLTLSHPHARVTWDEAIRAVARADGVTASRAYAGARVPLEPQPGLVPIGCNPVTRLWEFYHLRSAWDPAGDVAPEQLEIPRHREDGSIEVGPGTGIVFVLVPGGTFTMGAQRHDRTLANHDPEVRVEEMPPHPVRLAPFFIARHELTRAQWQRLARNPDPSEAKQGERGSGDPAPIGPTQPVENVSWTECTDVLNRHRLELPTEAQWEFACRAGTPDPWFTGTESRSLQGFANVADAAARRVHPDWDTEPEVDDGWATAPAPVGTFGANGFGLFDVHGNVYEWCKDRLGRYGAPVAPRDGAREVSPSITTRVLRGGGGRFQAISARSAHRSSAEPSYRNGYVGLRAARALGR